MDQPKLLTYVTIIIVSVCRSDWTIAVGIEELRTLKTRSRVLSASLKWYKTENCYGSIDMLVLYNNSKSDTIKWKDLWKEIVIPKGIGVFFTIFSVFIYLKCLNPKNCESRFLPLLFNAFYFSLIFFFVFVCFVLKIQYPHISYL